MSKNKSHNSTRYSKDFYLSMFLPVYEKKRDITFKRIYQKWKQLILLLVEGFNSDFEIYFSDLRY